jgi:hypothetical protein
MMSDTQNGNQGQQQQQQGGRSNAERLTDLLTFDPGRGVPLTGKAFAKVVREIKREKLATAQQQAKDLLVRAMDLQKQKTDAKRVFERQEKKFDKELGKVLKQIDNLLKGRPINHGQKQENNQEKDEDGNDGE